jgi:hypothetical protein
MPNTLTPEQSASQSTMLSQLASAKSQLLSIQKGMQTLPEIDMSKAPALGLDTTNITNALAGNIAQGTGTINQVTQATQNPPKQETSSKGFLQSAMGALSQNKPEPLDSMALYNQTLAQFGQSPESFAQIQNYLGQMTNVQNEIAKLEDQKALALGNAELEGQGYLESRVQGRLAIIERQYNSRIAAKSTVAGMIAQQYSMAMGTYQQAASMTKDIVDMATYDQKQKVDDFKWTFETYSDLFDKMETSEYRQWEKGQKEAEFEYTKKRDEVSNQLEQQRINISSANANTTADIQNYNFYKTQEEATGRTPKSFEDWSTGSTFTQTQLNKGAANASIPTGDFANLDAYTQNFFINNNDAIEDKKKVIDNAKTAGEDPTTLEKEISESGAPSAVIDYWIKYLWSVFPRPTTGGKHWYKPSTW